MEKMKLGQLLMALGRGKEHGKDVRIQVVMPDADWDDPVEACVDSEIFLYFLGRVVNEIGYEAGYAGGGLLIRAGIGREGDR